MTPMAQSTVRAGSLGYRYGRRWAVRESSFTLGPGVTGLVGDNGSGKSTLLHMLATLSRPRVGELSILGCDARDRRLLRTIRRRTSLLPQHLGFHPGQRVRGFLSYVAWLKAVPPEDAERIVPDVLGRLDLLELANRRLGTLSGGQLRRVGVALAIVNEPAVLLLDEPMTGIDDSHRIRVAEVLADLAATTTVLVSTHHLDDIAPLCGHVLRMVDGRVEDTRPGIHRCAEPRG
jgi:ABC-type multidrug transport system ATPase subunit